MKQGNDIKEYLGNRRGKAANRLEREALSDPFLYEALEGLSQTPDPIDGLIRLERQINERADAGNCIWKWAWGAVASIVVIVGVSIWLLWPSDEAKKEVILAQKTQMQPVTERKKEATDALKQNVMVARDTVKEDTTLTRVALKASSTPVEKAKKNILSDRDNTNKKEELAAKPLINNRSMAESRVKLSEGDSIMRENTNRFNKYVEKELRYPKEDLKENKEGEIRLSFEINSKGVPSRIRIAHGFSYPSNDEAIRLLVNGPRWQSVPGENRIDVVIRFELGKEGKKNRAVLRLADAN